MELRKRTILGWCFYDLSNTAFSALFVTLFFPLWIKVYLNGNEFQIGLVMGLSMLIASFFVPFIGALSDTTKRKMIFVKVFTLLCVLFTGLTPYVSLYPALLFGLLANLMYHSALDVYDAKLVDISSKNNLGKISGYGTALGYVGTLLSLLMAYAILAFYGFESKFGVQLIFPATAIFFILFSLPTFLWVKDKALLVGFRFKETMKQAWSSMKDTWQESKKYKGLIPFLLSCLIYMDGINTVIIFLYLYAREEIGLGLMGFFYVYAVLAVAAAAGSLIFGKINDKIGPKRTLNLALVLWILVILALMKITNLTNFLVAGSVGGAVLGAVWTVNRPMIVQLSPKHKIAEFFGYQGLTEKFSGVIGPVIFGYVVSRFNYTVGLSILLGFFVLGLIILQMVPSKR